MSMHVPLKLSLAALLIAFAASTSAQVAPLAPRRLAGEPPTQVETYAEGLARLKIGTSEAELIAALSNSDGQARSLAAAQLAFTDDHNALRPILVAMADEQDPQVQTNLAGAASWMGSNTALQKLQFLCSATYVPAPTRLDAARYLSNKNLDGCYSSIEQIEHDDSDPANRVLALNAAALYRGQADRAAALASAALSDLTPEVRLAAADVIRQLRKGSSTALASALKNEPDAAVRAHIRDAMRVLDQNPPPK